MTRSLKLKLLASQRSSSPSASHQHLLPRHTCGGFSLPSFGLAPAAPLQVHAPLSPNQTVEISLPLNTVGSVMKMEPLNNLQVGFPAKVKGHGGWGRPARG